MCTIIYRVDGLKTKAESTNERRVYIFYELIVEGGF